LWNHANAVALACKPDAAELASLCTKLLRDHASRQQMSQAGLNFYRDRFDWPNVIAILRSSSDVDRGFAASTTSNQSGSGSQLK
jgi:glycosyltransferase involved in cell wall biosynthesis